MTNPKCKLSSISLGFWHAFGLCCVLLKCVWLTVMYMCVFACRVTSADTLFPWMVDFFLLIIEFLKSRHFPRIESLWKKKVDWRLWYLNFGCDVTSYIYRSSYTRINVLVCLITFIFVIGINFEWDFSGFFKGFFPSVIVACGFILCFRDENESTHEKKDNDFIQTATQFLIQNSMEKSTDLTQIFFDGWFVKYWFTHFMSPLHFYIRAPRLFFYLWTHLNQIHCALWFVHKCTSMECLIQSTWNQNMGNKTKSSASIYEFRFCELETKKNNDNNLNAITVATVEREKSFVCCCCCFFVIVSNKREKQTELYSEVKWQGMA